MRRPFRPVLLLGALLAGLVGSATPSGAAGASAVPPPPFPTVTALAATAGGAPAYLDSNDGLYRSSAAPFSAWTRQNSQDGIVSLSVNPRQPDDLVYAGATGAIYRSTDGGKTVRLAAEALGIVAIARAATVPSTLYAAGLVSGAAIIARSTDDGRTWTTVHTETPGEGDASIHAVTVDPTNALHVLTGIGLYHTTELIESQDGGATWNQLPEPADVTVEDPRLLTFDPTNPRGIWAEWGEDGDALPLKHSADGGHTWRNVSPAPPSFSVATGIGFDPRRHRVYVSVPDETDGGIGPLPTRIYWTADDGAHYTRFAPNVTAGGQVAILGDSGVLITGDADTPVTIFRLQAVPLGRSEVVNPILQPDARSDQPGRCYPATKNLVTSSHAWTRRGICRTRGSPLGRPSR